MSLAIYSDSPSLLRDVPALAPLVGYLDGLKEGRADLDRLMEGLGRLEGLRWEQVSRFAVFSDTGYQRVRLCGGDLYEILLLCWKSGQQSPIHDHVGSTCGVRAIKGTCSETTFECTPSGRLCVSGTRQLRAGDTCGSVDGDIHLFANYEPPGEDLCTLHVYSPPLLRMAQYCFDEPGWRPFEEKETLPARAVAVAPAAAPDTIYLNNAATTWPKPEAVYTAMTRTLRGSWSINRTAGKKSFVMNLLEPSRARMAAFLGIADPQRLAIVPGCTWASNIAIQALPWKAGDRIILSGLEHNACSRPCRLVKERHGVELLTSPYRPGEPMDLQFVEDELRRGGVRLVVATMASNVTGEILPYVELRDLTRRFGARLLLDAAQAGGVLPLDVSTLQPDLMVFAGHKGLYGPPGIGLLYVAPGVEQEFFAVGGTGHDSGKLDMSARMPAMFEVGTFNGPAIAGLDAGIEWVRRTGTANILRHERELLVRFVRGLEAMPGIHVYGKPDPARSVSVVSCRFEGREPVSVAGWLAERGIVTRAGYHCAPLAHQTIGSHPTGGTVRFSFGFFATPEAVDSALAVLAEMDQDVGRGDASSSELPSEDEPDV